MEKDLGGTANAPMVTGLQGKPVSTNAPNNGEIMKFIDGKWTPSKYDALTNEQQVLTIANRAITISGTNSSIVLPEATTDSLGVIQLAGDLSGTATAPTVPKLALKENLSNKNPFSENNGNGTAPNCKERIPDAR